MSQDRSNPSPERVKEVKDHIIKWRETDKDGKDLIKHQARGGEKFEDNMYEDHRNWLAEREVILAARGDLDPENRDDRKEIERWAAEDVYQKRAEVRLERAKEKGWIGAAREADKRSGSRELDELNSRENTGIHDAFWVSFGKGIKEEQTDISKELDKAKGEKMDEDLRKEVRLKKQRTPETDPPTPNGSRSMWR